MKTPKVDADVVDCSDRQAWLVERTKSIGASESPSLLVPSDMGSPTTVYADKVSPPLFNRTTERQQWGLDLEGPILAAYQRKFGGDVKQWPQSALARSKTTPFMHCTPDAIVYEPERTGPGVGQVKTWSEFDKRAWSDEPPLYVQIQVQHEMYVTGCGWAVVPVLFGNSTLERFYVERNDRFIAALVAAVTDFWGYVVDRSPPPCDGLASTAKALARLHPNDNGLATALPDEADQLLDTLRGAKLARKTADDAVSMIENQLKAWLGDNTYGVTPSGEWFSWKSQTRKSYVVAEATYRVFRECKAPKGVGLPAPVDFKIAARTKLPKSLKERLLSDDPHCRWCGCTLTLRTATFEHLVPLAVGGTNDRSNITIACEPCNQKRGDKAALALEIQ